ncbi:MAG: sugar-binding protein [Candidatus Kapaibacterium sp.]
MKKLGLIPAILLLIFLSNSGAFAQNGLKFAELAQRLEPYFAKELISDVRRQLPQGSDYSIWGWDVGDFTGDGFYDCAVTVRLANESRRMVTVYMFADIKGYLTEVGQFQYQYYEIPLEIGVVIKNNACYVTRKREKFNWVIRGYTFDNGAMILLDEFTTTRLSKLTRETYRNYKDLRNTERYFYTQTGEDEFNADYMTIPSYQRGRKIYKGYASEVYSDYIDYVNRGAFYWDGAEDASFRVKSAYDDEFIYFTVEVNDDSIVQPRCDSCAGDRVDLWLDLFPPDPVGGRFASYRDNQIKFRNATDWGIFCISVFPGDFLVQKSNIKISTTEELEGFQKIASRSLKSVANLREGGYVLKFKVPFMLLGFQTTPVENDEVTEFGCTIVLNDIDNEFRPEEATEIATSDFFSLNPSSYGSLVLVPDNIWYGETRNIYKVDILRHLMELGF